MQHHEMVELIRAAVPGGAGTWADLGAGTGNFTFALRELLDPAATIIAVDRDARALAAQRARLAAAPTGAELILQQADITRPLPLPPLDGLLLANVLHFVRDQAAVLHQVIGYLRPGGRLVLVEYQLTEPVRWVPYPVPFERFAALAPAAGLEPPTLAGRRRSPSSGVVLFVGVGIKRR